MARLTIRQGTEERYIDFLHETKLTELLEAVGHPVLRPCGGRGSCGKCAVSLFGQVSTPNEAEQKLGVRLACQATVLGDAEVELPESGPIEQVQANTITPVLKTPMAGRFGAAIDLGTTTIVLQVYDLQSGERIGQATALNPQTSVAADVMGRIDAAIKQGTDKLQTQVLQVLEQLLTEACGNLAHQVDLLVITGNTTMLYLLTGREPECLAHAPFIADTLFDTYAELLGRTAYLPACMNAFVGADITCAVLACGMCDTTGISLLCDIGTNGEIALWKDGTLYVTATAAGPAFEGAGISCGCSSVRGAIDQVWAKDGNLQIHTIGDTAAVGICGSGLIDMIAALRSLNLMNRSGAAVHKEIELADGIKFLQKDIRAVQLAKAAIGAGILTLLDVAQVSCIEIETLYLAGGFGSHLNISSAVEIGLLPQELESRVKVVGNAALTGAAQMMLDQGSLEKAREIVSHIKHVNLGGNPVFNRNYMEQIVFP